MSEQNQAPEQKKGNLGTIVATAVIAGALGVTGTNLATDNGAPADKIDASVEMSVYESGVSNVQAVGMTDGMAPHLHVTWDNNANAKSFNLYVDNKKVNSGPIVVLGDKGRFTATNLTTGSHQVSVSAVGIDGTEGTPSDAVTVEIK